jgi:enoyl-CoA hydratase/carnithine racemase
MAGASHRVVTETARIAMPEITIGLYPDVGGSYFLNKMPAGVGLFLGLTGASINAKDAQFVGLADHFVNADLYGEVLASLLGTDWKNSAEYNHGLLSDVLHSLQNQSINEPASEIEPLQSVLAELETKDSLESQIDVILSLDATDNKWLSRAQKSLKHGSPLSAKLVSEQLKRAKDLSLADCFRLELGMSVTAGEFGEFQEGVRALLIDKDGAPNWQFENTQSVTDDAINAFFKARWSDHPLQGL